MALRISVLPLRKATCHQDNATFRPAYLAELSSMALRITALSNMSDRSTEEQEELETLVTWYALERDEIFDGRFPPRVLLP